MKRHEKRETTRAAGLLPEFWLSAATPPPPPGGELIRENVPTLAYAINNFRVGER